MKITYFDDIDLSGVSGVLIDLDDTLYSYEPAHLIGLQNAYRTSGWGIGEQAFAVLYSKARNRTIERLKPQGACRSRLFAFQAMCENRNLSQAYNLAYDLDHAYWTSFIASIKPCKPALNFLHRCKINNLPVCLVSDMTAHVQIQKLRQLQLCDHIGYMVTSEESGAEKPDARMFNLGLRKLNLPAASVIMIGDNIEKDVEGAAACGIKSYRVIAELDS